MSLYRDAMPPFELFLPGTVDEAVALLRRYGREAWILAGGTDSLDWFKDRIKRPRAVVDLSGIEALRGIRATPEGLEIGAMVTLREVARHPEIRARYDVLAHAAGRVGAPQLRNQGTLGGNLCQDTRCWYYRDGWPCYRAGGTLCYADTPAGVNREHAILGGHRCVTVNPSDTAPALLALEARMIVRGARGERTVDAADFFISPATDTTRMTILRSGDLLTAIRLPPAPPEARFYFEKVADREAWDFALVEVASAIVIRNGVVERARIAVNGVAPSPLRLRRVETWLAGRSADERTAGEAGALAVRGVRPLAQNAYKVVLLRNLVARAIRAAGVAPATA